MANTNQTNNQDLEDILSDPFVTNLLKFVADIRRALGDELGNLTNDEVVKRAREAYNQYTNPPA